ncbi:MAG: carbamoyl-phosphate synthase large subunit, partial [Bifidobacteriaceae bacterium]|nr:carbamoyl-phosphate synthase large subunit [Bifidobacteriaceae bacterium]
DDTLTTTMKSVGEAMAIGRCFTESLNKAMRAIDKKGTRFHWTGERPTDTQLDELVESLSRPTEHRLIDLQQAARWGVPLERLAEKTQIDPWFIDQIQLINEIAEQIRDRFNKATLRLAKRHGFADAQIGEIRGLTEEAVREIRHAFGLHPVYKMVDTCAGEFAAQTPYLYSSYDQENEVQTRTRPAVLILGSGPNRIGQGIEFDYSCVHAALALGQEFETVMINCNPETVSTDYDISGRLYFEPLTFEDVMEVYRAELAAGPVAGVIVQLGGQTPLSLSSRLAQAGLPMWGTPPEAIDAAENRGLFGQVLARAGLPAPPYGTALSVPEAEAVADRIGYPVLVRPSYVLGGRGMEIVYDPDHLREYMAKALPEGGRADAPVLIDRFLDDAIEIDVDALYDGHELFLGGVMEHIEEAGIHSGDSSCVLPPVTLSSRDLERIRRSTEAIAEGVGVRGLINIQFALTNDILYVLEANPRASRTVPFVSKATGVPLAKAACLIMAGASIADLKARGELPQASTAMALEADQIAVKEAVLPFARFRTAEGKIVDTVLGPEMRSTGEVMGRDRDFPTAFAKSQMAAFGGLPRQGSVFVSVADRDKRSIIFPIKRLAELGFDILATEGTASVLRRNSIRCREVRKVSEGPGGRTVVDLINAGEVDMVVNTPSGAGSRRDGYEIRAAITAMDRPIVTTTQQLAAAVQAVEAQLGGPLSVEPIQPGRQSPALAGQSGKPQAPKKGAR